jgi:hypothetical protein
VAFAAGDPRVKIVAALRELPSCVPAPDEGAGRDHTTARRGPVALPAMTDLE